VPVVRACVHYGCAAPRPCPHHRRAASLSAVDDRRGHSAARGYGSQWRRYIHWYRAALVRAGVPRAGLCGARLPEAVATTDSLCTAQGLIVAGTVVDHIVPVTGPGDPTFFGPANHQLLCTRCHNAKRQRERWHLGGRIAVISAAG